MNNKLEFKTKECSEFKQKYKNEIKIGKDKISFNNNNNNKTDFEKCKNEINRIKKENKDLINEIKEKKNKIDELN